jgi:hypothetical protein
MSRNDSHQGSSQRLLGLLLTGVALAVLVLTASAGATRVSASGARAASVPKPPVTDQHIDTWAFDDGCNGGARASSALIHKWVSFAEQNCGPLASKALKDCHSGGQEYCYVIQYMDTDWVYGQADIPIRNSAPNSWWLHSSTNRSTRVFGNQEGGGYLMNQTLPAVRAWWRRYVRTYYNHDDGLLMDDQSSSLSEELFYSTCKCHSTYEIRSNTVLRDGHNAMSSELTHTNGAHFLQADNTLAPNPFLPQGLNMLDTSAGVDGLIGEGDPEQYGVLDPFYSTLLDQLAYVLTKTTGFVVPMSDGKAGARTQTRSRRVQEATVLLAFEPGRMVDWADLEIGNKRLAVWPEEGIYPAGHALQTMTAPGGRGCLHGYGVVCSSGGHNNLEVAPGVYRREFTSCDNQGAAFGACATIINTNAHAVTVQASWLRQRYHHEITLHGGDIQSGGKINLAGAKFAPGASKIPADDAILLAP